MFAMGFFVGVALLITLVKMNWKWRMRMLSNPVLMDVVIFVGLTLIHWGTFSGVMVATIGALTCSVVLTIGRWMFGYRVAGQYIPGKFNVGASL